MLLNMQDEQSGCKLLLTLTFEGRQYEMGYMQGAEQPYITWTASRKAPFQRYMRRYFYSMEAALIDLQQRVVEDVQERITAFANQHG